MQERVGRRLPLEAEAFGLDAVDADVEQVGEARRVQDGHGVLAGGHHGGLDPRVAQASYEPDRPVEHLDALLRQELAEQRVLAVAEAADRLALGRIVRLAFGQGDAARPEEIAHAVEPGFAVHVPEVVAFDVERPECLPRAGGAAYEERIEKPLPSGGVHGRRSCHHAVEVERGAVECGGIDDKAALDRLAKVVCHRRTCSLFHHLDAKAARGAPSRPVLLPAVDRSQADPIADTQPVVGALYPVEGAAHAPRRRPLCAWSRGPPRRTVPVPPGRRIDPDRWAIGGRPPQAYLRTKSSAGRRGSRSGCSAGQPTAMTATGRSRAGSRSKERRTSSSQVSIQQEPRPSAVAASSA